METGQSAGSPRAAASRRRQPRDEVERRLRAKARELVTEFGLSVTVENLRVDDLLAEAGVPRTTFYRIWPSKDSLIEDLLEDLVADMVLPGGVFDPETLEIFNRVVAEHPELLATTSGRSRLLREGIRVGARRNFEALLESSAWRVYTAIQATIRNLSTAESRERVLAAMRATDETFIEEMAGFYTSLLPIFRYRLREGITAQHVAAAGAAIVEGFVQRHSISPKLVSTTVSGPGLNDERVEWHVVALAYYGLIQSISAPEPE